MNVVIPLLTGIISFIFAVTVLDQYFARRRAYQLVWAVGLFMYCISAGKYSGFTGFRWYTGSAGYRRSPGKRPSQTAAAFSAG